jgi:hypothetical protein
MKKLRAGGHRQKKSRSRCEVDCGLALESANFGQGFRNSSPTNDPWCVGCARGAPRHRGNFSANVIMEYPGFHIPRLRKESVSRRTRVHHSDERQSHGVVDIAVGEMSAAAQRKHPRDAFEKLRSLLMRHISSGRHHGLQLLVAQRDHRRRSWYQGCRGSNGMPLMSQPRIGSSRPSCSPRVLRL